MSLRVALTALMVIALPACATYRTTLTNSQGQAITCEASGKSGIVTGYYLRRGFEDCIDRAHAAGYTEGQAPQQVAAKQ